MRLTPSLREKVWGKTRLQPWFADSPAPIGEAWFLADRELPLLIKLLFTSERLSIQVHPDDGEDGPRGKTEMWHILEAEPGATIAMGFREPITRDRLREATRTGQIEQLVNWVPVKAGETYFIPAHTVHAIGAGIVLFEIQQNSDVTYRLWDYGRPRELHIDRAVPVCDLTVHAGAAKPAALNDTSDRLVKSKHFVTDLVRVPAGERLQDPAADQFWLCISGDGAIAEEPYKPGDVFVSNGDPVRAYTDSRFLRTWKP
jgi:mannose-6-phosphate isomerase